MRALHADRIESIGPPQGATGGVAKRHNRYASVSTGCHGRRYVDGNHDGRIGSGYKFSCFSHHRPVDLLPRFAATDSDAIEQDQMKSRYGGLLVTLILVAIAGAGGAWVGAQLLQPPTYTHDEFHDRLFTELRLSTEQQALMDGLEVRYADENKVHRKRLAEANLALADALGRENAYNDAIEQAIENVHMTMFELQKSTVRHLYEMRGILDEEQKAVFDRYVGDTLREYAN